MARRPTHGSAYPVVGGFARPLAGAFREEAFNMFRLMTGAWIVCLGLAGLYQPRVGDHGAVGNTGPSSAFRLFSAAAWMG